MKNKLKKYINQLELKKDMLQISLEEFHTKNSDAYKIYEKWIFDLGLTIQELKEIYNE